MQLESKVYLRNIRKHWPIYLLGTATVLLTSITEVLIPKFIQWFLDVTTHVLTQRPLQSDIPLWLLGISGDINLLNVEAEQVTQILAALSSFLFLVICTGLLGRVGWRQLLARRTHMTGRELKVEMWDRLRHWPLGLFQKYPLGDLMNRATGDWTSVRAIHGFTIVLTLDMLFLSVLSISVMMLIDWSLTLICIVTFAGVVPFISRLAKREHTQHGIAQEELSHLSNSIAQCLQTIRTQRATGGEAFWIKKLDAEADSYARKRFQVIKTSWDIFPLATVPSLIAYGVLLVVGLYRVNSGLLTIGEFVAFQSYILMMQTPLFELGDCIAEWQRGFASFGRMLEVLKIKHALDRRIDQGNTSLPVKEHAKGVTALASPVSIKVEDLTYSYGDQDKLLQQINLQVAHGENIGIYGPLGSGKSTLLKLLAKLIDAPQQSVFYNGDDISGIDTRRLRQHVLLVPQKVFLFSGTVRSNLILDGAYSDDELWHVLEVVSLSDECRRWNEGLETKIGESGVNLSGGQRQRLALARALLRAKSVLLMDDCLSAVDAVTEEKIIQHLKRELSHLTTVWVAHRVSTLEACDRIYKLSEGTLVQTTPTVSSSHLHLGQGQSASLTATQL